jgi:hypothetical protein
MRTRTGKRAAQVLFAYLLGFLSKGDGGRRMAGEDSGSDLHGELKGWIRDWMIEDAGSACSQCQWAVPNPVLKRPIFAIDHKDGNWQNNARGNLVVLCYNCHTLTPTFGSLNRGKKSGQRPGTILRNLERSAVR